MRHVLLHDKDLLQLVARDGRALVASQRSAARRTVPLDVHPVKIEGVGRYAIQISWSDGHDTGIFSWPYLYQLCVERESRWQNYLERLREAGASRDPDVQVVRLDL